MLCGLLGNSWLNSFRSVCNVFIYHSGDSHVCLCLYLVRFVPSWFPLASFKRRAEAEKKKIGRLEKVPFEWAINNIVSITFCLLTFRFKSPHQATGNFVDSFVSKHFLKDNGPTTDPTEREYIKWASSALYTAGGDTVSFLCHFLLNFLDL